MMSTSDVGKWMPLEEAFAKGYTFGEGVLDEIGPRRVGTVYRCGYWGTVNTVTSVYVRYDWVVIYAEESVIEADQVPVEYKQTTWALRVCGWEVIEYNSEDFRDRRHMTSWQYDRGNRVLAGPGDIRPRSERSRLF